MFYLRRPLLSAAVILSLALGASACSTPSNTAVTPPSSPDAIARAAQVTRTSTPAQLRSTPTPTTTTTSPRPINPSPGPGVANISIVPGGGGSGVVTSTPAGINCHQTSTGPTGQCGFNFPIGTAVELTGRPDPGVRLSRVPQLLLQNSWCGRAA